VDGYIIDLRNNPGGIFEEAITIASYFLDDENAHVAETVRYTDSETSRNIIDTVWSVTTLPSESFHTFPRHAWGLTSRPLVLLTNHGSASASEVMAGALQVCRAALERKGSQTDKELEGAIPCDASVAEFGLERTSIHTRHSSTCCSTSDLDELLPHPSASCYLDDRIQDRMHCMHHSTCSAQIVVSGFNWSCILQDHQRSTVIGEQTFGKGVVQYFFRMEDGSGLKLTVAKYLTPHFHDVALQGGIHPDIFCRDTPKALLPSEGLMDQCVKQGLRYMRVHSSNGGFGRLHASR
jgi:hypothetical protein